MSYLDRFKVVQLVHLVYLPMVIYYSKITQMDFDSYLIVDPEEPISFAVDCLEYYSNQFFQHDH